ncbi:MAG: YSC84-related protein [Gammaproteobacteria bacterium]
MTAALVGLAACTSSGGGWTGEKAPQPPLAPNGPYPLAQQTLDRMTTTDSSLRRFIDNAYGYAVFPTVSRGAFVVGGSYGEGAAFQGGKMAAKCSIAKASIGAQIGGETYSEVIFFQSRPYFEQFVNGHFTFSAGVAAIAVTAGAASDVAYNHGVAVFISPRKGLLAAAAVGGQNFSCHPVGAAPEKSG